MLCIKLYTEKVKFILDLIRCLLLKLIKKNILTFLKNTDLN